MNDYQYNLYTALMALVESNEAFYYADFEKDGVYYRIFNYRLASYSDFLVPGALECRGIMFEIDHDGDEAHPFRLVSLPMEKFFNLYENPFTMDLDLTTIVSIEDKADGSLISTYIHHDDLMLKTKGSINSDQCIAAMEWLNRPENLKFKNQLHTLAWRDQTVNMEWTAPDNRIVLGYEESSLRVLNIRDNTTGDYVEYDLLKMCRNDYDEILAHWTTRFNIKDTVEFVKSIPDMQNIEGFVVRLASGQRVKIKTTWYLALHHTKNSINSPRRLFEAVLEEATDDMKSLFHDDPLALKQIDEMEKFVEEKYNHMVDTVERFYERNKHLERKDYAILGQKELDKTMYFGLAMNKYVGKSVDYKAFLKSKWKQLGLKDEAKATDE